MLPLGFVIFPYLIIQLINIGEKGTALNYFYCGYLFGLGFLVIFLIWVVNPFLIYNSTKPFAFLSFFLAIFLSIFFGFSFVLFKFLNNKFLKIIALPMIIIFLEILFSNLLYGFPWITFSLILSNNTLGLFLVKCFGIYFAGFLIIFFFTLPLFIIYWKKIILLQKIILIIFFVIIISLSIFFKIYNYKNNNLPGKNISLNLFQINIPINTVEKNFSKKIYESLITKIQNSDSDILIFAENNYPYLINDIDKLNLNLFLKEGQKIIIGATRFENEKYYNSFLIMERNKIEFFDKKILVPFGEFLPLRKYLKFMENISGGVDYSSGSQERKLNLLNKINFIPIICYEIIFKNDLINLNNLNADLMINITNDSWFGKTIGPYQHFYLSRLRAVEYNKHLIRVSNNGISGLIDSNGKFLKNTKLNKEENIKYNLILKKDINILKLHIYFNTFLFILFIVFIFIVLFRKNARFKI